MQLNRSRRGPKRLAQHRLKRPRIYRRSQVGLKPNYDSAVGRNAIQGWRYAAAGAAIDNDDRPITEDRPQRLR